MRAPQTPLIRVFEADPDLLRHAPSELADRLRRHALAEMRTIPAGPWSPAASETNAYGLLMLDGIILRSVTLAGRRGVELFGSGDVLTPWSDDADSASVSYHISWVALATTRVAVLDRDFDEILARCPSILGALLDRQARRRCLAGVRSLLQTPLLEKRLMILLWQLADRWGHVDRDGIVLEVDFNQTILGDMVGAQRQSVSRALGQLVESGQLARGPNGWILLGPPPEPAPISHREPGRFTRSPV